MLAVGQEETYNMRQWQVLPPEINMIAFNAFAGPLSPISTPVSAR